MPTKSKLPRNKVPPPKLLQPSTETQGTSSEAIRTASGLPQEAEDQFELELCWCIQQLQAGLMDTKLQDKQVYNMTKSLNVLKSNNASLIKKRQVMRNTFGDYRSKMNDDEKKFSKSTSVVKFVPCKKQEKKSFFFKKASLEKKAESTINNPDVSNTPFQFNFSIDTQ